MPNNCYKIQRLAFPIYLKGVILPEIGNPGCDQAIEYIQTILCDIENIFLSNIDQDVANDSCGAIVQFNEKDRDRNDYSKSFNAQIIKDGYAIASLDEPNRDILNVLKSNQAYARSDKLGLWATGELDDLDKNV